MQAMGKYCISAVYRSNDTQQMYALVSEYSEILYFVPSVLYKSQHQEYVAVHQAHNTISVERRKENVDSRFSPRYNVMITCV